MSKLEFDASADAHEMARTLIGTFAGNVRAVLDVGCGSGAFLEQIAAMFRVPAWGIDPFAPQSSKGKITLLPLNAENISELNRRFDLIYTVHALHHFQNILAFFKGLQEVLSWSGRFVLVDWKKGAQTGIAETYFDPNEIGQKLSNFNFSILKQGQAGDNFYLVAQLKRRCLAVATDEQGSAIFPKMFGQAPYFDLYVLENGRFTFLKRRRNIYQKTLQHEKTLDVYNEVPECQALLARRIGRKGQQRLHEKGVTLFFAEGSVTRALQTVAERERQPA